MSALVDILNTVDHSREKRNYFANLILDNPQSLPELLSICEKVDDEISCKASWALEYLCKKNLTAILPYLDQIIGITSKVYQHPSVRPMAKIFECLIIAYYQKKSNEVNKYLTQTHREKITEICFDWLITDQKVAPQAYSMTTLYLLGTEFDWVHPELKIILENNYNMGSAAYKARSRMILKKLG
ncbi:adenylosuccinate lyase [Aquimarina celericrescens]|uniref:Adenylosuccinate lyase n=1 Tax=Aquimarina celericrescens TaxID=1964542 RepID=A0ABW5AYS6_9FLAO|nr:adenylosuccinate lyase [Aquimarina celericrescens]